MTSGANKGPLHTKVARRRLPLLADPKTQEEIVNSWIEEDHRKLLLLCTEFGIADGPMRFYELALALARKHYVGFQESAPLGKWTDKTRALLVVEVERLTADKRKYPSHSASWAAATLARKPHWEKFLGANRGGGGEPLRVQYQAFKNHPWAAIFRKAYKWHVHENTVQEWESDLLDALDTPHGL